MCAVRTIIFIVREHLQCRTIKINSLPHLKKSLCYLWKNSIVQFIWNFLEWISLIYHLKCKKKILTSGVSQNTNDLYFLYSFLLFEQTSVRHAFILIMEILTHKKANESYIFFQEIDARTKGIKAKQEKMKLFSYKNYTWIIKIVTKKQKNKLAKESRQTNQMEKMGRSSF